MDKKHIGRGGLTHGANRLGLRAGAAGSRGTAVAWLAATWLFLCPALLMAQAEEPPQPAEDAPSMEATDVARQEQLRDMLSNLDPALFNKLIGAEIDLEVVGDQVVLRGPEEAVSALEVLIRLLDETTDQRVLEVVRVSKRDGAEIARTVEPALRNVLFEPNMRPEDEVSVTSLSPSVLLVGALPKHIDFVIDVIHQVDELEEELPSFEQLVFPVRHRKASDVAVQLDDILKKIGARRGQTGPAAEIQIIPNNANNTIMIIAPETERERLGRLLSELDVEPVKGWGEVKLTLFPLLHSKANELAEVITSLLTQQQERDAAEEYIFRLSISQALPSGEIVELPPIDLQKPTRILPDLGTNSLIVATVEENIGPLGELIRIMDGVPMAADVDIIIRPLRYADAESVMEAIRKVFDDAKSLTEDPDGSGQNAVPPGPVGRALVYNIGLAADQRTNTLIAAGRPEQLSLVDRMLADLDQPATGLKFPLRLIALDHADATRLGQLATDLFDQRFEAAQATGANRAALERERVFLSVDIRSNTLIISASEENFEELQRIVVQLDTAPARLFDQFRIVQCGRLSASDLKQKIEDLWQRKADLRREAELIEDIPVIAVDERSNTLIVASSRDDFDEIRMLVETLNLQPRIEDIEMFKLNYADVTVVAEMLDELFSGMAGQSETFKAPTVLPDSRSNALMVAGSRDAMERVQEVIVRLDVEAGPLTALFKVYPLQYGSAAKLASRMQELFDSRARGQESGRTPIVILPEESSNALVASASRDDHDVIVGLLGLLDRPSSIARQFEIFPMRMARASAVAEKLENVFRAQGDGTTGRADAISTVADERTNSIIVWAAPSEMANIAEIIARLDTSAPVIEMMIKVVQLKQALAVDFAQLLNDVLSGDQAGSDDERAIIVSFLQKNEKGEEMLRRLIRQDIRIQADPRTNSLMIMAPAESVAMLEAMIHDFDRIRPVTSEIRLFPLLNSDAETMVDQLTSLFSEEGATGPDGQTRSQLVFGDLIGDTELATVGQELRFAADVRTNTLLAAGSPVYLTMIEDLVRFLDAQEAEDRVVEVYQAKYRSATDLAAAVSAFTQQEISVLGEGDDKESRMRRMERQISVEAIGQQEEGSSSLLVGTSRRGYQRTMQMIEGLDRPEPQVMISVLIAEVTVSDDFELGMEIAGQDLRFSKKAVLGPNNILQGSDFDYVAGTDLGAAPLGLGGFSFTVSGEDFSFLFRALQRNSRLEVLSRPILMVRNGEQGNITIADRVPIVESSRLSDTGQTQSTIGREDVGIVLTATPQISPDGYVTIAMKQEISNISGENVQLTEGVASPIFSTREVDTNVTVRDGETVIIGGLIQTRKSEGENKVPILGDLPIIGPLFRVTNISHAKTELIVVLTVDILRTDDDVRKMSVKQRDAYELPRSILQSPLMEGLRVSPQDSGMGPDRRPGPGDAPADRLDIEPAPARPQYGPRPRSYGPVVARPMPAAAPPAIREDSLAGPATASMEPEPSLPR